MLTETQACTAYTRYVLDIGQSQDYLALQLAMAPCLLGYYAVAEMLRDHADTKREDNRYWAWIENYVAEDYTEAVRLGSGKFPSPESACWCLFVSKRIVLMIGCRVD